VHLSGAHTFALVRSSCAAATDAEAFTSTRTTTRTTGATARFMRAVSAKMVQTAAATTTRRRALPHLAAPAHRASPVSLSCRHTSLTRAFCVLPASPLCRLSRGFLPEGSRSVCASAFAFCDLSVGAHAAAPSPHPARAACPKGHPKPVDKTLLAGAGGGGRYQGHQGHHGFPPYGGGRGGAHFGGH
jgi:hypothetical protein